MLETTKTALVFSGAGAQYTGMCKDLYEHFEVVKNVFCEASDILHTDMASMCFDKEKRFELNKTENAHVALAVTCASIYKVFQQEINFEPNYLLGHSLGEYFALYAGGAISFAGLIDLVKKRSIILKETSEKVDGTMNWVINVPYEVVKKACEKVSEPGNEVYISVHNYSTHYAVSGHKKAVLMASKLLEEQGAIIYPLKEIGPIHCPLMQDAVGQIRDLLAEYEFCNPKYNIIANQSAKLYKGKDSIAENLQRHLVTSVKWHESMRYLYEHNVNIILEISPKDVLSFLVQNSEFQFHTFLLDQQDKVEMTRKKVLISKEDRIELIEQCLKIPISVKNYNLEYDYDYDRYISEVVMPYKKIESLYDTISKEKKLVSKEQVEESLEIVKQVLTNKHVPKNIIMKKLDVILAGRVWADD